MIDSLEKNRFIVVDPKEKIFSDQAYFDEQGICVDDVIENFQRGSDFDICYDFQKTMIEKGYIEAICPFSGKLLRTNISIVFKWCCFYKFKSNKKNFWIVCAIPSQKFSKQALILELPNQNLILIKKSTSYSHQTMKNIASDFLTSYKGLKGVSFLGSFGKRKKCIVCDYSFFHLIWNELTGLEKLYKHNLLCNIDKIIVRKTIFDLAYFFPNLASKLEYRSISDIKRLGGQCKFFFIRVGETFITQELIEKIYQYSYQNVSKDFLSKVAIFRKKYRLIVAISIRGEMTKLWRNQINGIATIINQLQEKYPDLGIVLDGFSITDDRNISLIEEKQQAIAKEILFRVKKPESVWNTIGCVMFESIVLSRVIDTYLCTQGSQQHKWGWFGNKPGVIHGPKQRMLKAERFKVTSPAYSIANPVFCFNVNSQEVCDLYKIDEDPEKLNLGNHQNYDFDWRLAYEKIDLILSKLADHKNMGSGEWNEMVKSYNGRISDSLGENSVYKTTDSNG